tara:strand:- start:897 stop:1022 length:126 start_codon:yes stop_codon:yes gene_type:complete
MFSYGLNNFENILEPSIDHLIANIIWVAPALIGIALWNADD